MLLHGRFAHLELRIVNDVSDMLIKFTALRVLAYTRI